MKNKSYLLDAAKINSLFFRNDTFIEVFFIIFISKKNKNIDSDHQITTVEVIYTFLILAKNVDFLIN